jgi:small GTP-binding protein
MLTRKFHYSLKVVVVGDSGVGKTCFLVRYVRDLFEEETNSTLGVEFLTKIVQTDKHKIQLQLWDTAGQEIFRSVTRGYYRGAAGALIVFDLTSMDSFLHVGEWLQDIRDVARSDVVAVLIGNKLDLASDRKVSAEKAAEFAKANGLQYFETSAKDGSNVSAAVDACVSVIEKNVGESDFQVDPHRGATGLDFAKPPAREECC